MEQQFINLKQGRRTVDEYAAEFVCLSRFAPYMVVDKEDRAHRFHQGLRLDLQKYFVTLQFTIYIQVIDVARDVERVMNKEKEISTMGLKSQFNQVIGGSTSKTTPTKKRPFAALF